MIQGMATNGNGAEFYNYKGFCSVVLLATVDAEYNFMYVSVGANGRCNDAGTSYDSALYTIVWVF